MSRPAHFSARWAVPIVLLASSMGACAAEPADLPPEFASLLSLHKPLGEPQPGDWLTMHPEPGQTYREYLAADPVTIEGRRKRLYIQPLGEFTATERRIVRRTSEYMEIYFGLPVKVLDDLPLSIIPDRARRVHPSWGMPQIQSLYVLQEVLYPRLPEDAAALIALTASDLWPGEGWNFVFGQASLSHRVGVWSLYRNGDPDQGDEAFRLCLRRTLRIATHETSHMFSMAHCTAYECNMCGSNHRAEADRYPLWLCPHCMAKLCHATGADPVERLKRLIAFCRRNDFDAEQAFFEKSLEAMQSR